MDRTRRGLNPGRLLGAIALALAAIFGGGTGTEAAAALAAGTEASRQSATVAFTTPLPAGSSGLDIDIDYVNPADPEGKPPAVRQIFIRLAKGTRIDTTVPPVCEASDQELIASGPAACPGTTLGEGFIGFDTGFPPPLRMLEEDVTFLNGDGQIIFATRDRATGARLVSRATVLRRRLTSSAPTLPGTPPDGAAVDVVRERLDAISVSGRHYITTPRSCPVTGYWRHKARFTYADGVRQLVVSRSPCDGQRRR